uniref:Uncharacterized protein n=1 Tax=Heterorhabditis bacteriophora TaxID=37862 RepID=A0A1I7W6L2_HETBA
MSSTESSDIFKPQSEEILDKIKFALLLFLSLIPFSNLLIFNVIH